MTSSSSCPQCGKSFDAGIKARRHVREVHGPKPFTCTLCPHATAYASHMREHLQRLHKVEVDIKEVHVTYKTANNNDKQESFNESTDKDDSVNESAVSTKSDEMDEAVKADDGVDPVSKESRTGLPNLTPFKFLLERPPEVILGSPAETAGADTTQEEEEEEDNEGASPLAPPNPTSHQEGSGGKKQRATKKRPIAACNKCRKVFTSMKRLENHMKLSHNGTEESPEVRNEEEESLHDLSLLRIRKEEEEDVDREMEMETEDKEEEKKEEEKSKEEEKAEPEALKCPKCDFQTKVLIQLQLHDAFVHNMRSAVAAEQTSTPTPTTPMAIREVAEEGVEDVSAGASKRKSGPQQRRRTSDVTKPFSCDVCGMRSKARYDIDRHRRQVHDKIFDFKCSMCDGFEARYQAQLVKHVQKVHPENADRVFACDECDFGSRTKTLMNEHGRSVHGVMHTCKQCGYSSNDASNLTRHMRTKHTGTEYDLAKSSNPSMAGDLLPCDVEQCDYRANGKGALTRHVKTNHNNRVPQPKQKRMVYFNSADIPDEEEEEEEQEATIMKKDNGGGMDNFEPPSMMLRMSLSTLVSRPVFPGQPIPRGEEVEVATPEVVDNEKTPSPLDMDVDDDKPEIVSEQIDAADPKPAVIKVKQEPLDYSMEAAPQTEQWQEQFVNTANTPPAIQAPVDLRRKSNRDSKKAPAPALPGTKSCTICGYSTHRPNDMTRHREKVHERTMEKCPSCEYECIYVQTLVSHVKKAHPANPERVFVCTVEDPTADCDFGAKTRREMTSHRVSAHGKQGRQRRSGKVDAKKKTEDSSDGASIKCKICNYTANEERSLTAHLIASHITMGN